MIKEHNRSDYYCNKRRRWQLKKRCSADDNTTGAHDSTTKGIEWIKNSYRVLLLSCATIVLSSVAIYLQQLTYFSRDKHSWNLVLTSLAPKECIAIRFCLSFDQLSTAHTSCSCCVVCDICAAICCVCLYNPMLCSSYFHLVKASSK